MHALPPCLTPGQPLNPCAVAVHAQHVDGFIRLHGPWRGWKIQGHHLIGPGGVRWTVDTLAQAAAWQKSGLAG
jgi:hypothetical protein